MKIRKSILLIALPLLAAKPSGDIPVTSTLLDVNAAGTAFSIQSDAIGVYTDSSSLASILVANGYNGISDGDWRLDLSTQTARTLRVTFSQTNAVQPGDPGYTAPANPPYWGTKYEAVRMENKCTLDSHDMLTMNTGDKFTCPMSLRFPPNPDSSYYRLDMDHTFTSLNEPETQDVQISCNSANSTGCDDWFIDPVPVVNPDGTTSPGQTRARLDLIDRHGNATDHGDFYMTFHFHITQP